MYFRPAGWSDDEDDDDGEGYWREDAGLRPRCGLTTNGGPKSVGEAILLKDAVSLEKCIAVCKSKKLSLEHDANNRLPPLLSACTVAWEEGIKLLLEHGANPNVKIELTTPLIICCTEDKAENDQNRAECVQLLLQHGADPNFRDHRGRVPLMLAAKNNLCLVLDCLLKCLKTDRHAVDPFGWTALFFALKSGNQEAADKLIAAGLNPETKAFNSITALELRPDRVEEAQPLDKVMVSELFKDPPIPEDYDLDIIMDDYNVKQVKAFLALLPDNDGLGGFSDCVNGVLEGAGCASLDLPDAQLPDILSGDEQVLLNLGVKFSNSRQKILKAVHRFHFLKWNPSSVSKPPKNDLRLEDVGNFLTGMLRHLVIINAAVQYLSHRVANSSPDSPLSHRDMAITLIDLHKAQSLVRLRIQALIDQLRKVSSLKENPVDYIGKCNPSHGRKFLFKVFSVVATALGISYLYFVER